MSALNNLKVGHRLTIAFGALLVLLAAVGGLGLSQAARINDGAYELATDWMPSIRELDGIRAGANAVRRADLRHVLETTAAGKARQAAAHDKALREVLEPALQRYAQMISAPEEQRLYDGIREALAKVGEEEKKLLDASNGDADAFDRARALAVGSSAEAFTALSSLVDQAVTLNSNGGIEDGAKAATAYRSALALLSGLIAVSMLFGVALAWFITRGITVPVREAIRVARTVASGDLSSTIVVDRRDEAGELLGALREMNGSLSDIVGRVRESSDHIAAGSAQIATGNANLSQRTEEQASSLQQTAASMEQISGTVKTTAETAREANALAASASAAAVQGGERVACVVETMNDIAAASKRIAEITGVIDGIAFQTNILALNAAVEAARAGEQGRGFAVVASEVRNLAGRAAAAAKEIKALISASVEKVEVGGRQVDAAGASMSDIVSRIQRVDQLVHEISNASAEQSGGVEQVGQAVAQLDQVTQQNAALVEESAAAAESLRLQSDALLATVRKFSVAGASSRS